MRMFAVLFALISVSVWMLLFGVPMIDQWERAHNYPFGHMCDIDNSCHH
jgi:hypothetical protein